MSAADEPFGESPPSNHSDGGGFAGEDFESTDGPILPPYEAEDTEGFALREWRRQNAIRLEEKEKEEKEKLKVILEEAEEYKEEFYKKRQSAAESNKTGNREKEKVFLENREKFHAEAEQNYWKAIPELIPREVAAIEKRGKKKKDDEAKKQPSIVVVQGPKPGKPTDLSRMRQILLKLKHNTPLHMNPKPPEPEKDPKAVTAAASSSGDPSAPPSAAKPVAAAAQ